MKKILIVIMSLVVSANIISQDVVINEINYKSSIDFAVGDWVEFHNTLDVEANVGGWIFKDELDEHIFEFPAGTIIPGGGFLVIVKDGAAFSGLFPSVYNYIGDLDFSLSGGGELIRIFDNNGTLIDQVTYDDDAPWPIEPDGNGPTLELTNPNLDNTLAESWSASTGNGTPGAQNSSFVGIRDLSNALKFSIYPNPAQNSIRLEIPSGANTISLFDVAGNQVLQTTNKRNLQVESLASGTYIVRVHSEDTVWVGQFVKE